MTQPVLAVDSTKAGKFHCTVRKHARGMQLQGSLCRIDIDSGHVGQVVLGHIGTIDTTNLVHENPAFAPLIMEEGSVDYFSKDADIETAVVEPIACVDAKTQHITSRKANPASGTPVYLISNEDMQMFLNEKEYLMNVGFMPGYLKVIMSIQNRHYGDVETGGWGEARHRLYAGQNGSGKTVFALQHLAGRAIRFKHLGVLIPDTKGDIARDRHSRGDYKFSLMELLTRGGRNPRLISVDDIRLESIGHFASLVAEFLKPELNTTEDKASELAFRAVRVANNGRRTVDIKTLRLVDILEACESEARFVWTEQTAKEKLNLIQQIRDNPQWIEEDWKHKVVPYFSGSYSTTSIAKDFLQKGDFIILDISTDHQIQARIMSELFRRVKTWCEIVYKQSHDPVNAEVFLDEAPRWVPQATTDDPTPAVIRDAANTTRAYGLSWTFITQRLASIHKDVFAQSHTKWFGRNLGVGADRRHMEEELGRIGIELYDSLQLNQGYFYLGVGGELNLGAGHVPMAVMGWGDDVTQTIVNQNPHIWSQGSWC